MVVSMEARNADSDSNDLIVVDNIIANEAPVARTRAALRAQTRPPKVPRVIVSQNRENKWGAIQQVESDSSTMDGGLTVIRTASSKDTARGKNPARRSVDGETVNRPKPKVVIAMSQRLAEDMMANTTNENKDNIEHKAAAKFNENIKICLLRQPASNGITADDGTSEGNLLEPKEIPGDCYTSAGSVRTCQFQDENLNDFISDRFLYDHFNYIRHISGKRTSKGNCDTYQYGYQMRDRINIYTGALANRCTTLQRVGYLTSKHYQLISKLEYATVYLKHFATRWTLHWEEDCEVAPPANEPDQLVPIRTFEAYIFIRLNYIEGCLACLNEVLNIEYGGCEVHDTDMVNIARDALREELHLEACMHRLSEIRIRMAEKANSEVHVALEILLVTTEWLAKELSTVQSARERVLEFVDIPTSTVAHGTPWDHGASALHAFIKQATNQMACAVGVCEQVIKVIYGISDAKLPTVIETAVQSKTSLLHKNVLESKEMPMDDTALGEVFLKGSSMVSNTVTVRIGAPDGTKSMAERLHQSLDCDTVNQARSASLENPEPLKEAASENKATCIYAEPDVENQPSDAEQRSVELSENVESVLANPMINMKSEAKILMTNVEAAQVEIKKEKAQMDSATKGFEMLPEAVLSTFGDATRPQMVGMPSLKKNSNTEASYALTNKNGMNLEAMGESNKKHCLSSLEEANSRADRASSPAAQENQGPDKQSGPDQSHASAMNCSSAYSEQGHGLNTPSDALENKQPQKELAGPTRLEQGIVQSSAQQEGENTSIQASPLLDSDAQASYTLIFKTSTEERKWHLKGEESLVGVFSSLFGDDSDRKLLFEGIKISKFLSAEDNGFHPGLNFVELADDDKAPVIPLPHIVVQVDDDRSSNINVPLSEASSVDGILLYMKEKAGCEREKAFLFNGKRLAEDEDLSCILADGYVVDMIHVKATAERH